MFVAYSPRSMARRSCSASSPSGRCPPASSACSSSGIRSSTNARARLCSSRSCGDRPYMAMLLGPVLHEWLTDRSVYASVGSVNSANLGAASGAGTADAVVVGGGTVGAWAAWFLRRSGLSKVVLLEAGTLGQGASSRAAGMVRAQGGTPTAVRLGMFSRDFYVGQAAELGIDSGFVAQGYHMPAFSPAEVSTAKARIAMQQECGLDVTWLEPDAYDAANPNVAPGRTMGASFAAGDGYIDPPRNVLAYTAALFMAGVDVRERTPMTGLVLDGGRVTGVRTPAGVVATDRVVIT